jgi:DNA-binding response OmpR family regulator
MPETPQFKVLIVDDSPLLLDLLTEMLIEMGNILVFTASDGIQALEQYEIVHPDCMVIDVKMPGLNGFQVVSALRGDPSSVGMPLIILTALTQDKERFVGMASGADQYLVKPVTPQVLFAAIQKALASTAEERKQRLDRLMEERLSNEH